MHRSSLRVLWIRGLGLLLAILPFSTAFPATHSGAAPTSVQIFQTSNLVNEKELNGWNTDLDLKLSRYIRLKQAAAIAAGGSLKDVIHTLAQELAASSFKPSFKSSSTPSFFGRVKGFFGFGGAPRVPDVQIENRQTPVTGYSIRVAATEEGRLEDGIRGLISQILGRIPTDASLRSTDLSPALLKSLAHAQNAAFLLKAVPLGINFLGDHNDLILRGRASGVIDFPIVNFLEAMVDGDGAKALRTLDDFSEMNILFSGQDVLKIDLFWSTAMIETLQKLQSAGKRIYATQHWNLSLPLSLNVVDIASTFTKKPDSMALFQLRSGDNFFAGMTHGSPATDRPFLVLSLFDAGGASLHPNNFGTWLLNMGRTTKLQGARVRDFLENFLVHPGEIREMCTLMEKSSYNGCPHGCDNAGGTAMMLNAGAARGIGGGLGSFHLDSGSLPAFRGLSGSGGGTPAGLGLDQSWGNRSICGGASGGGGGGGGVPAGQCNGRLLTPSGAGSFSINPELDHIMRCTMASIAGGVSTMFQVQDMSFAKNPMCRVNVSYYKGDGEGETPEPPPAPTEEEARGIKEAKETLAKEVNNLPNAVSSGKAHDAIATLIASKVNQFMGTSVSSLSGQHWLSLAASYMQQAGHVTVSETSETHEHGFSIERGSDGNQVVVLDQETLLGDPGAMTEALATAAVALSIDLGGISLSSGPTGDVVTSDSTIDDAAAIIHSIHGAMGPATPYSCASEGGSCGSECSFMEAQLSRMIECIDKTARGEHPLRPDPCRYGRCEDKHFDDSDVGFCMPRMKINSIGVCGMAVYNCAGSHAVTSSFAVASMSGMDLNQCCSSLGGAGGGAGEGGGMRDPICNTVAGSDGCLPPQCYAGAAPPECGGGGGGLPGGVPGGPGGGGGGPDF